MERKIRPKLVLQLRTETLSGRAIASSQPISRSHFTPRTAISSVLLPAK